MSWYECVLWAALGYLVGSVPFGLVIGKAFYHTDIRESGSHNLGGTNAGRVLGAGAGFLVIALDVLKCAIPMALIQYFVSYPAALVFGMFVPLGHCWPLFAQFKGGKAVASSWGFIWGTVFFNGREFLWICAFPLAVMYLIVETTKHVSVGSMCSVLIAVLMSLILRMPWYITLCYTLLWLLIVWRHKANIQRLKSGTESRIKW